MFNYIDGPSYYNGTTKTGCWTYGGKNDTDNHYVQTHQAQNGRICVSQSLYPIKQR